MSADCGQACCGCCQGAGGATPVFLENRPGLSALAYRVGTHARFKESMLAGISAKPALRALTTRDDDDPTIALLDAWATTLDVLTFYQERIANEGFLRTATERRSLLELARTIGYELRPGVASSTWLAFTLDGSPGSPREVTIPAGTRAQSLPTKSELPQSFETGEPLLARPEWNALRPRLLEPQTIGRGTTEVLVKGIATRLQPGDAILFAGRRREADLESERWDFRIVRAVEPRPDAGVTRIAWEEGLGRDATLPEDEPRLFVLRQRAALFGYNAPDWRPLPKSLKEDYLREADGAVPDPLPTDWPDFKIRAVHKKKIDLDAVYPKIVTGSWVVLQKPTWTELYKVVKADTASRTDFLLTAKTTRLELDVDEHLAKFGLRETVVFAESEELEIALQPIGDPVSGVTVTLESRVEGLAPGRAVVLRGQRMRAIVNYEDEDWQMELETMDGSRQVPLTLGESLILLSAPVQKGSSRHWHLLRRDGMEGIVKLPFTEDPTSQWYEAMILAPAEEEDPEAAEVVFLEEAILDDERTTLNLVEPLVNVFDRPTVAVFANVAPATHGETRREVLGGGDAAKKFQRFRLRQKPLTYVPAPVASGGESTLELRVNGVLWHESPDFYRLGPRDRKYVLRRDDEGSTTVWFGDGVHGARLPSGVENVEAVYRTGIGLAGLVGEDRISLLATRPLGVKSVTNPVAASGAEDPEIRDLARQNAPTTVLTLDRVVSLRDFEDFARSFSGIGKAQARMLWERGGRRLVHLTVAGEGGQPVDPGSALFKNLREALDRLRDPFQALEVASFDRLLFRVKPRVKVDPDHVPETVLQRVEAALRNAFSFAVRGFGQSVHLSEVMAVAQRVEGVVYVDVDSLYLDEPATLEDRLLALPARINDQGEVRQAQILLLSPVPVLPEVIL